jgi:hypothetical protein
VELNQDDLPYFVDYVLLDEAWRTPSGKRQTKPMKGFWMLGQGKLSLRQSDSRVRRSACIEAFKRVERMSVGRAAAHVASALGRRSAAAVEVMRVAYYECASGRHQWRSFFDQFLFWRKWVLKSNQETLRSVLNDYGREFGQSRRQRLAGLFDRIRRDPVQGVRNREWRVEPGRSQRARIEFNYWNPESDWQHLATDLWFLGRLHAEIGETGEAKALLERALHVWKTHGHKLAHVQAEAIPHLDAEIARLSLQWESASEEA